MIRTRHPAAMGAFERRKCTPDGLTVDIGPLTKSRAVPVTCSGNVVFNPCVDARRVKMMSRKVAVRQPPIEPTPPDAGLSTADRARQNPAHPLYARPTAP